MSVQQALITGACGEIGQALAQELTRRGGHRIVTSDLAPLPDSIKGLVAEHVQGDLLFQAKVFYDYDFDVIFHLAASLSSKAEQAPEAAHRINVDGTMQLLAMAAYRSEKYNKRVKFLFPSSIAVYGLPSLEAKQNAEAVKENEWNDPRTMYGCNKLYCEKLGGYYGGFYGQKHLNDNPPAMLDFRALRFPGLVSAATMPSGGTSDYGPEMLHAAAKGEAYACFVRADARLPFMAMPDAIQSILDLTDAPRESLTANVYNVGAFSLSAEEFRQRTLRAFPQAQISFAPNPQRQGIVDSWPADVDDSRARRDWNWSPRYDADGFFDDYFLPKMREKYG
ncbi:MAG: NAD-dependent epimerase/dehydratase family protein [Anaerolineales bacterium]|nr:NAD-dependent epimerase/dehydratase family protein [Anaerolineales bacterium]